MESFLGLCGLSAFQLDFEQSHKLYRKSDLSLDYILSRTSGWIENITTASPNQCFEEVKESIAKGKSDVRAIDDDE